MREDEHSTARGSEAGRTPREFTPMTIVNFHELQAKGNESMLPRLFTSTDIDEMPD
jgi:hypothetical protein